MTDTRPSYDAQNDRWTTRTYLTFEEWWTLNGTAFASVFASSSMARVTGADHTKEAAKKIWDAALENLAPAPY